MREGFKGEGGGWAHVSAGEEERCILWMDARSDSAGALAGPGRGGSVINLTLFQVVRTIRSTARVRVLAGARACPCHHPMIIINTMSRRSG